MSTPHKHKDLIIAWANGAEIQYNSVVPGAGWKSTRSPTWSESYNYRIKPQPKKCRVALMRLTDDCSYPSTILEKDFLTYTNNNYFIKWISPVIEYFEE